MKKIILMVALFYLSPNAHAQQQQQQQICADPDSTMDSYGEYLYDNDGNQLQGTQAVPFCKKIHPEPNKVKTSALHDLAANPYNVKTYFIQENQTIDTGKKHIDGSAIRVGCGKIARDFAIQFYPLQPGESAVIGYFDDAVIVVCQ